MDVNKGRKNSIEDLFRISWTLPARDESSEENLLNNEIDTLTKPAVIVDSDNQIPTMLNDSRDQQVINASIERPINPVEGHSCEPKITGMKRRKQNMSKCKKAKLSNEQEMPVNSSSQGLSNEPPIACNVGLEDVELSQLQIEDVLIKNSSIIIELELKVADIISGSYIPSTQSEIAELLTKIEVLSLNFGTYYTHIRCNEVFQHYAEQCEELTQKYNSLISALQFKKTDGKNLLGSFEGQHLLQEQFEDLAIERRLRPILKETELTKPTKSNLKEVKFSNEVSLIEGESVHFESPQIEIDEPGSLEVPGNESVFQNSALKTVGLYVGTCSTADSQFLDCSPLLNGCETAKKQMIKNKKSEIKKPSRKKTYHQLTKFDDSNSMSCLDIVKRPRQLKSMLEDSDVDDDYYGRQWKNLKRRYKMDDFKNKNQYKIKHPLRSTRDHTSEFYVLINGGNKKSMFITSDESVPLDLSMKLGSPVSHQHISKHSIKTEEVALTKTTSNPSGPGIAIRECSVENKYSNSQPTCHSKSIKKTDVEPTDKKCVKNLSGKHQLKTVKFLIKDTRLNVLTENTINPSITNIEADKVLLDFDLSNFLKGNAEGSHKKFQHLKGNIDVKGKLPIKKSRGRPRKYLYNRADDENQLQYLTNSKVETSCLPYEKQENTQISSEITDVHKKSSTKYVFNKAICLEECKVLDRYLKETGNEHFISKFTSKIEKDDSSTGLHRITQNNSKLDHVLQAEKMCTTINHAILPTIQDKPIHLGGTEQNIPTAPSSYSKLINSNNLLLECNKTETINDGTTPSVAPGIVAAQHVVAPMYMELNKIDEGSHENMLDTFQNSTAKHYEEFRRVKHESALSNQLINKETGGIPLIISGPAGDRMSNDFLHSEVCELHLYPRKVEVNSKLVLCAPIENNFSKLSHINDTHRRHSTLIGEENTQIKTGCNKDLIKKVAKTLEMSASFMLESETALDLNKNLTIDANRLHVYHPLEYVPTAINEPIDSILESDVSFSASCDNEAKTMQSVKQFSQLKELNYTSNKCKEIVLYNNGQNRVIPPAELLKKGVPEDITPINYFTRNVDEKIHNYFLVAVNPDGRSNITHLNALSKKNIRKKPFGVSIAKIISQDIVVANASPHNAAPRKMKCTTFKQNKSNSSSNKKSKKILEEFKNFSNEKKIEVKSLNSGDDTPTKELAIIKNNLDLNKNNSIKELEFISTEFFLGLSDNLVFSENINEMSEINEKTEVSFPTCEGLLTNLSDKEVSAESINHNNSFGNVLILNDNECAVISELIQKDDSKITSVDTATPTNVAPKFVDDTVKTSENIQTKSWLNKESYSNIRHDQAVQTDVPAADNADITLTHQLPLEINSAGTDFPTNLNKYSKKDQQNAKASPINKLAEGSEAANIAPIAETSQEIIKNIMYRRVKSEKEFIIFDDFSDLQSPSIFDW